MAEEQKRDDLDRPKPPSKRRFIGLRQWESQVDRQIREAQERGEFDNLPSRGRPIKVESWDTEWSMAHHILKQSGETLPWIALGNEIEQRRAGLRDLLERAKTVRETYGRTAYARTERDRIRTRYLNEAAEVDEMMVRFSFETPIRDLDKGRLPKHIAEQQFDKIWPLSEVWAAEEQARKPER